MVRLGYGLHISSRDYQFLQLIRRLLSLSGPLGTLALCGVRCRSPRTATVRWVASGSDGAWLLYLPLLLVKSCSQQFGLLPVPSTSTTKCRLEQKYKNVGYLSFLLSKFRKINVFPLAPYRLK